MKKFLLLMTVICLCIISSAFAQVQYYATKVSTGKWDAKQQKYIRTEYSAVSTQTTINLYNNAISIKGDREFSLKFVRKINRINPDGSTQLMWNAVGFDGKDPCTVTVIDQGTYSIIAFYWESRNSLLSYRTL